MSIENIFGSIAFITSIIGLLPQLYKAINTRSTNDVSMLMLINYAVCSIAWIVYGHYSASRFVEFSNIFGLLSCFLLIIIKYHCDHSD